MGRSGSREMDRQDRGIGNWIACSVAKTFEGILGFSSSLPLAKSREEKRLDARPRDWL